MLSLVALHVSLTYDWVLEGNPSPERIEQRARDLGAQLFSDWPMTVVPAKAVALDGEAPPPNSNLVVPAWQCLAVLRGPPRDPTADEARMVVIWWTDDPRYDIDIATAAAAPVWRDNAGDFTW